MAAIPTIPEYFSEKNVFITGGSGFIGKVLIEKLLRSCPDIGKIYLLIRPKKGKNSQERIQFMTDLPLFDVLKKSFPENLAKIVPISGDVKELELGLSPQDKKTLIDEVHIVYHIAASVRFDDPLKDAVLMNTRGTREVARLAKEMKHLDVLMHFSTTYCNTDKQIIEEQIYPPHADWEKTIELAETLDAHALDVLSVKYIHPLPNTYTFTKSLGEHVIADLCDGQVPSVIFRPSIVISTMTDPFSGWIDNFNGPVGILVASGKGVMRACYANKENIADYVPCDSVVKAVIMATWSKGLEKNESEKNKVSVYNASNYDVKQVTFGEIIDIGKQLTWDIPVNDVVWYPDGSIYSCWYAFYTIFIVYQLIPSLLLDALLLIMGYKPILLKIQRKIYIANMALRYYLTNQWKFPNKKVLELETKLLPSDFPHFNYEKQHKLAEPFNYFSVAMMGCRRYLLKETDETLDNAKVHFKRMYLLAQVFNSLWYIAGAVILFYIYNKVDLVSKLNDIHTFFNTP
nr:putative fatty acyl-CoA reductase CG5065 [Leptinotarsa decemlineata]